MDRAVEIITDDRERWVDTMLTEELGLTLTTRSPFLAAPATMTAFMIVGSIPLVAFIAQAFGYVAFANPYAWSTALTGVAFFGVGAIKSQFVEQLWYWSGLETLALGAAAASLAYFVGLALAGIAT